MRRAEQVRNARLVLDDDLARHADPTVPEGAAAHRVFPLDQSPIGLDDFAVRQRHLGIAARRDREQAGADRAPTGVLQQARVLAAPHDRTIDLARSPGIEKLTSDLLAAHAHREVAHRRAVGQRQLKLDQGISLLIQETLKKNIKRKRRK